MLDIKGGDKPVGEIPEPPRPRPKLEIPSIEPEKNYLLVFSFVALVLVIAGCFVVYIMNSSVKSEYNSKLTEKTNLMNTLNEKSLKDLDNKIQSIQQGLSMYNSFINKLSWSKMFSDLSSLTPANIKFNGVSVDENKLVKINGISESYIEVAKFIRSLENSNKFKDVKLVSTTYGENNQNNNINYAITFSINESAFSKEATNGKLK